MVLWLRTSHSEPPNTTAATPRIAAFNRLSAYMPSMNSSMITAMVAPISRAMYRRVSLNRA